MSDITAAKTRIKEIGAKISPDIMLEMRALFATLLAPADASTKITRELSYGAHERHRLNVFAPANGKKAPVLVFVHGGGFVTGDKDEAPGAFYDNVGLWAARHNLIGATINYRLAPQHPWPAGHEDVRAAIAWIVENIVTYGGDPQRIFLMGHSAGAAHVAAAIAEPQTAARLAGVICMSGIYDLSIAPVNAAYFDAPDLHAERSPLEGLAATPLPLLSIVAEYDPLFIQRHSLSLWQRRLDKTETPPRIFQISGHNHFSAAFHLNTEDEALGAAITHFIGGATKQKSPDGL